MLQKHVDMCREEDDSTNIIGLNNISYDSEEEEEEDNEDDDDNDEDDPLENLNVESMCVDCLFPCSQRILQFDYISRFGF